MRKNIDVTIKSVFLLLAFAVFFTAVSFGNMPTAAINGISVYEPAEESENPEEKNNERANIPAVSDLLISDDNMTITFIVPEIEFSEETKWEFRMFWGDLTKEFANEAYSYEVTHTGKYTVKVDGQYFIPDSAEAVYIYLYKNGVKSLNPAVANLHIEYKEITVPEQPLISGGDDSLNKKGKRLYTSLQIVSVAVLVLFTVYIVYRLSKHKAHRKGPHRHSFRHHTHGEFHRSNFINGKYSPGSGDKHRKSNHSGTKRRHNKTDKDSSDTENETEILNEETVADAEEETQDNEISDSETASEISEESRE